MINKLQIPKNLILPAILAFLILTSGCRTASHLLNPDSYSSDNSEPWEKNAKPKKPKTMADEL